MAIIKIYERISFSMYKQKENNAAHDLEKIKEITRNI